MTAFQTYAEAPTAGQAGHICASTGSTGQPRTLVRATDAAIDCALAVCNGTTPGKTVKAPTTAAEAAACVGILLDPVYLNEIGATNTYSAGQPATVLEEGYLWVNSEGTVAEGDLVYVRHTSDGGSNTTRGTLRNDSNGGVTFTTSATTNGEYRITLSNGVVEETFSFTASSSTAAQIVTGLVAAIDASANFAATGTTTGTVTAQTGSRVRIVSKSSPTTVTEALWATTDTQLAVLLKGARWAKARTGAGLTKIRLQLRQDF